MTCSASSPPRGRSPERATEWGAPTWPPTPSRRSEAPRPSRGAPRPPDSFTGCEIAEGRLAPRPCRGASRLCSPRALQLEPSLRRPPTRVPHALRRGSPDHVPARGAGRSAAQRHGPGRVRPILRRLVVDPGRRDLAGMAAAPRARPRVHRSAWRRAGRSRRYPVPRTARPAARSAPRRAPHATPGHQRGPKSEPARDAGHFPLPLRRGRGRRSLPLQSGRSALHGAFRRARPPRTRGHAHCPDSRRPRAPAGVRGVFFGASRPGRRRVHDRPPVKARAGSTEARDRSTATAGGTPCRRTWTGP